MPATLRPRLQKAPPPATAAPKETRGRKRNRGGRLTKVEEEQKERRREAYLRRQPPGAITTQPDTKIVFNTPYDVKHTCHIRIINTSCRRIGWAIKTTNMKRLGVDPACGVLDPKEATLMAVSCDAFAYGQKDTNNDRITIEWTNTPDGVAKQFRPEWLQRGDWPVGRKDLPIEYNP